MKRKLALLLTLLILSSTVLFLPKSPKVYAATILYNRINAATRMLNMARIYWTPKSTFKVLSKDGGSYYEFTKGVKYYGMPYTWKTDSTYNEMLAKCTWDSTYSYRIFNNSGNFGNDCSTAVALAWQAGGVSIEKSCDTNIMLSQLTGGSSYIKKVGVYTTIFGESTYDIVYREKDKMNSAYTLLKKGDCCFYDYSDKGHAILIYENYPNSTTPYILAIEQNGYSNFAANKTTWFYLKKYYYSDLKAKYYVPITNDVFLNTDRVNG